MDQPFFGRSAGGRSSRNFGRPLWAADMAPQGLPPSAVCGGARGTNVPAWTGGGSARGVAFGPFTLNDHSSPSHPFTDSQARAASACWSWTRTSLMQRAGACGYGTPLRRPAQLHAVPGTGAAMIARTNGALWRCLLPMPCCEQVLVVATLSAVGMLVSVLAFDTTRATSATGASSAINVADVVRDGQTQKDGPRTERLQRAFWGRRRDGGVPFRQRTE